MATRGRRIDRSLERGCNVNMSKEDLLLHPVRLRVILAVAGRRVTAQQLAAELPDVPQASLYRNLRALVDAGIVSVVEEHRVKNTVERTFALPETNLTLSPADLEGAGPTEHLRLFTRFLGMLLGYFSRYAHSGRVDLKRDRAAYQMFSLDLSDAEAARLSRELSAVFKRFAENKGGARRRFVFSITAIPEAAERCVAAGPPRTSPRPTAPGRERRQRPSSLGGEE